MMWWAIVSPPSLCRFCTSPSLPEYWHPWRKQSLLLYHYLVDIISFVLSLCLSWQGCVCRGGERSPKHRHILLHQLPALLPRWHHCHLLHSTLQITDVDTLYIHNIIVVIVSCTLIFIVVWYGGCRGAECGCLAAEAGGDWAAEDLSLHPNAQHLVSHPGVQGVAHATRTTTAESGTACGHRLESVVSV
jgi:hypothetical protein